MCARVELHGDFLGISKKGFGQESSSRGRPWKSGMYFQDRRDGTHICSKKGKSQTPRDEFTKQNDEWCFLDHIWNSLSKAEKDALRYLARKVNKDTNKKYSGYSLWMEYGLKHRLNELYKDYFEVEMIKSKEMLPDGGIKFKVQFKEAKADWVDPSFYNPHHP